MGPGQQFADWNSIDTSKPGLLGAVAAYGIDKSGLKDWMNGKGISYSPQTGLGIKPVQPPSMGTPVSRGEVIGTPLAPLDQNNHDSMINGAFGLPDEPKEISANEQQPFNMPTSTAAIGAVPPPPEMGGGIGDILKMYAMG